MPANETHCRIPAGRARGVPVKIALALWLGLPIGALYVWMCWVTYKSEGWLGIFYFAAFVLAVYGWFWFAAWMLLRIKK